MIEYVCKECDHKVELTGSYYRGYRGTREIPPEPAFIEDFDDNSFCEECGTQITYDDVMDYMMESGL